MFAWVLAHDLRARAPTTEWRREVTRADPRV
jgi:hypothetical protein